jgi:hypothetical protein
MHCKVTCILYKKQAHFSQLFCLQVRSVTPWQSHDRKSRCLRSKRHSSILYSPSGLFSSYFINEVNFYRYKKYVSVGRLTIFGTYVFKSNLEYFWQMSCWSPIYVPGIETRRHVKNNAYTVEIKIKWMIRKHMTYENTYRDDKWTLYIRKIISYNVFPFPAHYNPLRKHGQRNNHT